MKIVGLNFKGKQGNKVTQDHVRKPIPLKLKYN